MRSLEGNTRQYDSQGRLPWMVRYYIIDGPGSQHRISPICRTEEEANERLQALRETHPKAYVISAQFSPLHYREDEQGNIVFKSHH